MHTYTIHTTSSDNKSNIAVTMMMPTFTPPKAILQIVHGITEHSERYFDLCKILTDCFQCGIIIHDQIGHGKSVSEPQKSMTIRKNGWKYLVKDIDLVRKSCEQERPEIHDMPIVLFGFSLGSFVVRDYLTTNHDVSGAIIAGTGWQPKMVCTLLANIMQWDGNRNGRNVETDLTKKLLFDNYNKPFGKQAQPMSWLSEQEDVITAYIADPLSAKHASCGYFEEMLRGMATTCNRKAVAKIPDIPILLISGEEDPVGNKTKGVNTFKNKLLHTNHSDVKVLYIPKARHDVLHCQNENNTISETSMFIAKVSSKYYSERDSKTHTTV